MFIAEYVRRGGRKQPAYHVWCVLVPCLAEKSTLESQKMARTIYKVEEYLPLVSSRSRLISWAALYLASWDYWWVIFSKVRGLTRSALSRVSHYVPISLKESEYIAGAANWGAKKFFAVNTGYFWKNNSSHELHIKKTKSLNSWFI